MGEEEKAARLRRMRGVATATVVAMLALYAGSTIWQHAVPWMHWVRAFSEAGTAGAIADWYAVVALFRHPLGLPLPHSAIIPRNKDRIAESIGAFVETNFLTASNVVDRLDRLNLAGTMSAWLREPDNSRGLSDALCDLIPPTLATVEDAEVRAFLDRTIASQFKSLDLVAIVDRLMTTIIDLDHDRAMFARILLWLREWFSQNREAIRAKFSQVSRYTPGFLDAYIVNRFVEGIGLLLKEAAENPDHEIWREIDRAIEDLREEMRRSPELRAQIAAVARDALSTLGRSELVVSLWADIRREVVADLSAPQSQIRARVAAAFERLGATLADEQQVQQKLNAWWIAAIGNALPRVRPAIGRWIADIVKSWDADEITRKIEIEIGTDLQFIRLNGAMVGGLVGLCLHAMPFQGRIV
jgi:uncharacterized membrane-anchored protein YjiN (DUF445 family)